MKNKNFLIVRNWKKQSRGSIGIMLNTSLHVQAKEFRKKTKYLQAAMIKLRIKLNKIKN